MASLQNLERAFIDEIKLRDYCLNALHPLGKHKARLFEATLGMQSKDAALLKQLILGALPQGIAKEGKSDEYGKRFTVDLNIRNFDKQAIVVTAWIILSDANFPRLVSCFVKK